jgi:hypothetical protein
MFYVYYGYVSPDNCDTSDGPTYLLEEFNTEEEVIAFKEEFEENLNDETSHVIFRVIKGKELSVEPVEKVTTWKLS